MTAAIVDWNTVYLDRAVRHLRAQGVNLPDELLAHVTPLGWEHIALTGDYDWTAAAPPDGFRPATRRSRCVPAPRGLGCGFGKQTGIETQSCDDAEVASDGGKELEGGECGVTDDDDAAAWQPAVDLQSGLTSPVQQGLGRALCVGIEALGRRKHGEKGQAHDAAHGM